MDLGVASLAFQFHKGTIKTLVLQLVGLACCISIP